MLLGESIKLVYPRSAAAGGPVIFDRVAGVWRRRGIHVPDSVRIAHHLRLEGWVNSEEQDVLKYWFSATALPNIPTHIGLFTTLPVDAGTGGVEVTGGAYARQAFARNGTNWGSSTAGAPSTIQSLVALNFPQASANWGTIVGWGYFTAVTAGTLLFFAALDTNKAVNNGDTASLAAGGMIAQLGDPGDTY